MRSNVFKTVSIMAVLAALTGLAEACPGVPHASAYLDMHQSSNAQILGFDPASTADPGYLPHMMSPNLVAQTAAQDLGFDLASTADPGYLPQEPVGSDVVAGTSEADLWGKSDLSQVLDPTAAGETTPSCEWQ